MPIKFEPNYDITPKIANYLVRIEAAKQKVLHLPFINLPQYILIMMEMDEQQDY